MSSRAAAGSEPIPRHQVSIPRKVRWGVVGSGGIAIRRTIPEGILRARNAELVGVCGRDRERNKAVADAIGVRAADSVETLLGMDLDAVYIATPPAAHLNQVTACASARKHVLCEKPLTLSLADAEAMRECCRSAGVLLGAALMMRFHAQHQAALELIRAGRLGQPVFARAQLSCWYPPIDGAWRQDPASGGGGSLMDLGGHCIDLLEMLFGAVVEVTCMMNRTVHAYGSEDSAVVILRFANGALGSVDAFFCIPDESSRNVLELYGTQGSILARGTIGQREGGEMLAYLCGEAGQYDAQQGRLSGQGKPVSPAPVNTYRAEIEEFSQAIIEGRSPMNHGDLGVRSQQILDACYRSAKTGSAIQITPPRTVSDGQSISVRSAAASRDGISSG